MSIVLRQWLLTLWKQMRISQVSMWVWNSVKQRVWRKNNEHYPNFIYDEIRHILRKNCVLLYTTLQAITAVTFIAIFKLRFWNNSHRFVKGWGTKVEKKNRDTNEKRKAKSSLRRLRISCRTQVRFSIKWVWLINLSHIFVYEIVF